MNKLWILLTPLWFVIVYFSDNNLFSQSSLYGYCLFSLFILICHLGLQMIYSYCQHHTNYQKIICCPSFLNSSKIALSICSIFISYFFYIL